MTHPTDSLLALFNACEALLWMVLACVVGLRVRAAEPKLRRPSGMLAGLLVAFAISDLIEIQTGAWWQPPTLLIFKALCLVGLIASTLRIIALQRLIAREKNADNADKRMGRKIGRRKMT